ncbi:tripartite tricarboxylate transporter substrate-binding protein [Janibacter melonis]|uniref:tripartite tricarboxylate transporter substrate-binding protein n=1 Tax=Janibacter melonis TaxID=262209 RepID=UPI002094D00A|nr:tripartite tricarboxylate transporter substrate-binding protein [Janibacter melonis]
MCVGASAGGSSDLISRAVSKGLSDSLGGTFAVINREGANGALAEAEVKDAKNDGSVIGIQNASLFAITPLAVKESEVTSIDDVDVVGGVSRWPAASRWRRPSSRTSSSSTARAAEAPSTPRGRRRGPRAHPRRRP